jgi:hypothetical protein
MERKKASDFPRELLNLFDGYVHGGISRRQFLDGAQKFAVGGVTAVAVEMADPLANTGIEKDQPDRSLIDGRATTRRTISKSIFERLRG